MQVFRPSLWLVTRPAAELALTGALARMFVMNPEGYWFSRMFYGYFALGWCFLSAIDLILFAKQPRFVSRVGQEVSIDGVSLSDAPPVWRIRLQKRDLLVLRRDGRLRAIALQKHASRPEWVWRIVEQPEFLDGSSRLTRQ
jgi:hypothetical protein